ncbi:MAG: hypothetical protein KBH14_01715 [Vicinamibacteria bacterium]|nr:hypothetical protein [Vicinamibacteria bacterium]
MGRALATALIAMLPACAQVEAPGLPQNAESAFVKRVRQVFARVPATLAKNHKTFAVPDGVVSGFGAGEAYPQIWLRDSAWIVPAAASYYDAPVLTSWLDLHLAVAAKNGRLRDWVAASSPETFREWAPQVSAVGPLAVDTNTNESDQEPSAALAYCRAREVPAGAEAKDPAHLSRLARLVKAMDALLRDRTDPKTGLLWSGLTADWGDVSPLYPDQRAIYLDAQTPRTLSLYSNVMTYAALNCLSMLEGPKATSARLAARATKLRDAVRCAFWMKNRGYFRIRLALDPTPEAFAAQEDERFALGGNALAALHGVADDDQAAAIFETAERLRKAHRFSTISTTLIPPYPASVFQHPAMREPFQYQNGGQWDWYGAALVEAEFTRGHARSARAHLDQILSRTLAAGPGLHEWYAQDGSPKGSPAYAASAAALHGAILRGLLGLTSSKDGYRLAIRVGDTLERFEVPQRAAGADLAISQIAGASSIEVTIEGRAAVHEVCSVLPVGATPLTRPSADVALLITVRPVGADTMMCADVATLPRPIRVRFAFTRTR